MAVINEKFDAHEKLEGAHDDLAAQSIATLQTDMSEMKDDVKALSRDIKTILSNGHFK